MRYTLIRVLKSGVPTALMLAALGWVMAEGAGMWLAGQTAGRSEPGAASDSGTDVASTLRTRLPLAMAAWGFGIVLVFELVLSLWRGGKAPAPQPVVVPPQDEVEKLLNDLLRQAEAAEAARAANPAATPVPDRPTAENSPVPH